MLLVRKATRTPGSGLEPLRLRQRGELAAVEDDVVSRELLLGARPRPALEVRLAREQGEGEARDATRLEARLFHGADAEGHVGLAADEVDRAIAAQELELERGMALAEAEETFAHEHRGERLGGGDAHEATHVGACLGRGALERASLRGHPLGVQEKPIARGRQAQAIARAQEETGAEGPLEACDAAARGRAVLSGLACPRGEAPRAGDGMKDADVVPVHGVHHCTGRDARSLISATADHDQTLFMTSYRAVMLTRPGGPEVLEVVELPVIDPGPGEARVRVVATGAGGTDVTMRRGGYRYAPPIPFVPGYEIVGDVEAIGPGVTGLRVGQRVAALVVYGGYAEKIVRPASEFVPVPDGLDPGEVVALVLNYVTAYQAIHRVARLKAGDTALVTGASGGVGAAALELLRVAGVQAFGAASPARHAFVRSLGATPIDSRGAPIHEGLRAVLPGGVDAAFDGLGGRFVGQAVRATRRGGVVVGYGFSGAVSNAARAQPGTDTRTPSRSCERCCRCSSPRRSSVVEAGSTGSRSSTGATRSPSGRTCRGSWPCWQKGRSSRGSRSACRSSRHGRPASGWNAAASRENRPSGGRPVGALA